jgi:hypothetical protein
MSRTLFSGLRATCSLAVVHMAAPAGAASATLSRAGQMARTHGARSARAFAAAAGAAESYHQLNESQRTLSDIVVKEPRVIAYFTAT